MLKIFFIYSVIHTSPSLGYGICSRNNVVFICKQIGNGHGIFASCGVISSTLQAKQETLFQVHDSIHGSIPFTMQMKCYISRTGLMALLSSDAPHLCSKVEATCLGSSSTKSTSQSKSSRAPHRWSRGCSPGTAPCCPPCRLQREWSKHGGEFTQSCSNTYTFLKAGFC